MLLTSAKYTSVHVALLCYRVALLVKFHITVHMHKKLPRMFLHCYITVAFLQMWKQMTYSEKIRSHWMMNVQTAETGALLRGCRHGYQIPTCHLKYDQHGILYCRTNNMNFYNFNKRQNVKNGTFVICLHNELTSSSALQSWKWQWITINLWYWSGHLGLLPTLMDNKTHSATTTRVLHSTACKMVAFLSH